MYPESDGMLFDCSTDNIGLHLKNIFASGELVKDSVTEKISATASDGKTYQTQFYNLDAVISVAFPLSSLLYVSIAKILNKYGKSIFCIRNIFGKSISALFRCVSRLLTR